MTLNATQHDTLDAAINDELQCQALLARARAAAARKLAEHYESEDDANHMTDAEIRTAVQFTARPFHPLMTIIRAETRSSQPTNDASPDRTPAIEEPGSAITPTMHPRTRTVNTADLDTSKESTLPPPHQQRFKQRKKHRAGRR